MRSRFIATVAASVMLVAAVASAAPTPDEATITPSTTKVTWAGSRFVNAATPAPEACVLPDACDRFTVHLALGAGAWNDEGGALQIGIKWKLDTESDSDAEYDTFDLYVYDEAGALIASSVTPIHSSMGIASSAQVVDIPNAADGDYAVVVVPSNVADRDYQGVAMLQSYAPPIPSGDLLPDLRALQPANFKLQMGTLSLSRVSTDLRSCYVEETAQDVGNPTRCLRFDAGHSNLGNGPFLVDVDLHQGAPVISDNGTPTIGGPVYQVIRDANGTERRAHAGDYKFHPNHGHIHYRSFAQYDLYNVDETGVRTTLASPSRKSDFCLIDSENIWFGLPGNMPRDHHFPQCNVFDKADESGVTQRQGINRGWADIYTWDLPGQYIDISAVPDGIYDVVNAVNPDGALTEMDDTNNTSFTRIQIVGDVVTCLAVPGAPCPPGAGT